MSILLAALILSIGFALGVLAISLAQMSHLAQTPPSPRRVFDHEEEGL